MADASDSERERMLNQWIDDHGSSGSKDAVRKLPHKLSGRSSRTDGVDFDEDEDDEPQLSLLRDAPSRGHRSFKKPKLWPDNSQNTNLQGDLEEEDGQSV